MLRPARMSPPASELRHGVLASLAHPAERWNPMGPVRHALLPIPPAAASHQRWSPAPPAALPAAGTEGRLAPAPPVASAPSVERREGTAPELRPALADWATEPGGG